MSALLRDIARVTEEIKNLERTTESLRDERLRMFRKGRSQEPPVTFEALAEAAQMSKVGAQQILRRAKP